MRLGQTLGLVGVICFFTGTAVGQAWKPLRYSQYSNYLQPSSYQPYQPGPDQAGTIAAFGTTSPAANQFVAQGETTHHGYVGQQWTSPELQSAQGDSSSAEKPAAPHQFQLEPVGTSQPAPTFVSYDDSAQGSSSRHALPKAEGHASAIVGDSIDGAACMGDACGGMPCGMCGSCAVWDLRADLIGLRRSEANDYPIISEPGGAWVPIDAGNIEYDYELGIRARATRHKGCKGTWEFGYLGVPKWEHAVDADGDLQLNGPGFDLGVNPGWFTVHSESSLHSGEINFRKDFCCGGGWFTGFRYIRFDDDLTVSENNAPFPNALEIEAANNLYGFHFGGDYCLFNHGGPLSVSFRVAAGMYVNDANHLQRSSFIGPPIDANGTELAFSGELELTASYRLHDCFKFYGGYHFLGIGGMALAPDQINAGDFSRSRADIYFNNVTFDGGFIGCEVVW